MGFFSVDNFLAENKDVLQWSAVCKQTKTTFQDQNPRIVVLIFIKIPPIMWEVFFCPNIRPVRNTLAQTCADLS